MNKMLRVFSLLTLACLSTAGAELRAADADYGTPAGSVMVPNGLSAGDVQKCIVEAAMGRGWTVRSRDDEKVVVMLNQEKWSSVMTLLYTKTDVQLFSKSTKSGKPKLPENWIKYLKQDLTIKMNTQAVLNK